MKLPRILLTPLRRWALRKILTTSADKVIGGLGSPYMIRWYVLPRNRFLNVYLHLFLRSDDPRALHDHPWESLSVLLMGHLVEETPQHTGAVVEGTLKIRTAASLHRIEMLPGAETIVQQRGLDWLKTAGWPWREATDDTPSGMRVVVCRPDGVSYVVPEIGLCSITLFMTGPRRREWGFLCPQGWRPWYEFVDPVDEGAIGPGCGEP